MRQNQEETEDIIDLGVLLKALLRRWWVILLTTILCGGLALIGSILLIAPTYSSGFTAYIDNSKERVTDSISSTDISASKELVSTYSAIIRSRSVVEDAIQKANISCTYEYMEDKVIVQEVDDTGIIEVSVVTEDSKMSYEMAKALRQVTPKKISQIIEASSMSIINPPQYSTDLYGPNYKKITAIGALIGGCFICMLIILKELLDDRVKSDVDLEERYDIPVMGIIHDLSSEHKQSNGRVWLWEKIRNKRTRKS